MCVCVCVVCVLCEVCVCEGVSWRECEYVPVVTPLIPLSIQGTTDRPESIMLQFLLLRNSPKQFPLCF